MLACNVGKHILIVSVLGQGIHSLFQVEKMPKDDIVMGCTRLYEPGLQHCTKKARKEHADSVKGNNP